MFLDYIVIDCKDNNFSSYFQIFPPFFTFLHEKILQPLSHEDSPHCDVMNDGTVWKVVVE